MLTLKLKKNVKRGTERERKPGFKEKSDREALFRSEENERK